MHPLKIQPGEHQYIPSVLQNGRSFKCQNLHIVSFLPLGGSQFSKLWLSQSEGVGQAGSRGWCGRAVPSGWGYAGANRLLQCFGTWFLTHIFLVLQNWESQCENLCGCSPQQFLRQELKAPAVSLQCSDFCSTLPCLALTCLVMCAAFLATDLSVYMQSFTCLCAFMKKQHRNQHWHMRLMLALEKSCLHLFACVFHYAAKVVLARLRWVWSGLPEDPWCKTRRSKALEKNAVLFTGVSKAFVKMLLFWS